MYRYKVKYIVVVEDEYGNCIEPASDECFDTEEEAQKFLREIAES